MKKAEEAGKEPLRNSINIFAGKANSIPNHVTNIKNTASNVGVKLSAQARKDEKKGSTGSRMK